MTACFYQKLQLEGLNHLVLLFVTRNKVVLFPVAIGGLQSLGRVMMMVVGGLSLVLGGQRDGEVRQCFCNLYSRLHTSSCDIYLLTLQLDLGKVLLRRAKYYKEYIFFCPGLSRDGWHGHSQASREDQLRGEQGLGERRRDSWNRGSIDKNSFDDVPEWSKSDSVFEPDLGSFDSSGAFCVMKVSFT